MVNKSFYIFDIQQLPLVSIGIPFFNASFYLADAINSVINQSYKNWELILIDDGSTDDSLAIAQQFKNPQITIISDGKNLGLVHRLNQITSIAKGDLLARMDADDIMHRERIAIQVQYLLSHQEVDILGTSYVVIDEKEQVLGISNTRNNPAVGNTIYSGEFMAHPTVMARKEWFKVHPYDPTYIRAEDKELWIRVGNETVFRNIVEPLFFYRVHYGGFSKYYATNKTVIRLFLYGIFTHGIPFNIALVQIITFVLKTLTYSVFALFKQSNMLIKRRYIKPDKKTLTYLYDQLNKAKE